MTGPDEGRKNPHGRRTSDHLKWWVLVVGALFQGSFALAHKWSLEAWKEQIVADRAQRQVQHEDMMRLYAQNREDLQDLAKQIGTALDVIQSQAGELAREKARRR